jgi:hypothetical protein
MSQVAALARIHGENEDEWTRKWAKVHVQLEQEGKVKLLPPRHDLEPRERLALIAARLVELDRALPDGEPKLGADNYVQAWGDLADYLRRLALIFNPKSLTPAFEDGRDVTVTRFLSDLEDLAERTGVQGWQALADRIRAAYEEAARSGGRITPAGDGYYVDEFAGLRAELGRQAAQLAQDTAWALADTALTAPSLYLHRYARQSWAGFAVSGLVFSVAGVLTFLFIPPEVDGLYDRIVFLVLFMVLAFTSFVLALGNYERGGDGSDRDRSKPGSTSGHTDTE